MIKRVPKRGFLIDKISSSPTVFQCQPILFVASVYWATPPIPSRRTRGQHHDGPATRIAKTDNIPKAMCCRQRYSTVRVLPKDETTPKNGGTIEPTTVLLLQADGQLALILVHVLVGWSKRSPSWYRTHQVLGVGSRRL